ncbi:BQ2448_2589 [Microbotryum intermedium]|uniref:BQ2448_2589 protein n=1 Tax=Microbotryum intermedium TaxID=269621 RepID=A0A238F9Y8_9BASI|nr:BQ2448_2589 [Microbotryum intermedium]
MPSTVAPLVKLALGSRWIYFGVCYIVSVLSLTLWYYAVVTAFRFDRTPKKTIESKAQRLHRRMAQSKKRSWIFTGTAALIMTVASIPFNYDLLRHGLDPRHVHRREAMARAVVAFFVAYLNTESCMLVRHSASIRRLMPHHSETIRTSLLEAFTTVIRRDVCHIFCGAAIMELPTAVLALSMLVPRTRSDLVFTSLFFLTRILYHIMLIAIYASKHGVAYSSGHDVVDPTYIPLIGLVLAAPLHVSWFSSALIGMIRRRRKSRLAFISAPMQDSLTASAVGQAASTTEAMSLPPLPAPEVVTQRPKLVSLASSYLSSPRPFLHVRSPLPTPTPTPPTRPLPSPSRRHLLEQEVREFFLQARRDLLPQGAQNWLQRDENDILKAQLLGPSLNSVRLRARRLSATGGADVRRFGGRVRRSLLEGRVLPLGLGGRRAAETA